MSSPTDVQPEAPEARDEDREHGKDDRGPRPRPRRRRRKAQDGDRQKDGDSDEHGLEVTAAVRCGRWEDVLADVRRCDSVITDPPYSARTAAGQRGCRTSSPRGSVRQSGILYGSLTEPDVRAFVQSWLPRTRRWFVMFGDHLTTRWALEALTAGGWYSFAPVPWCKTDAAPRIMGDGPSSHAEFIAIARSRFRLSRVEKRYRPGWYQTGSRSVANALLMGAKPPELMAALVRDYSEPGQLIVDPFAGTGSTLIAARQEGRRSLGAECDLANFAMALGRLARPYTRALFPASSRELEQLPLPVALGDR